MRTHMFWALTVSWAVSGICESGGNGGTAPLVRAGPSGRSVSKKPVIAILGRPAGGPAGPEGFPQGVRPAICPSARYWKKTKRAAGENGRPRSA